MSSILSVCTFPAEQKGNLLSYVMVSVLANEECECVGLILWPLPNIVVRENLSSSDELKVSIFCHPFSYVSVSLP